MCRARMMISPLLASLFKKNLISVSANVVEKQQQKGQLSCRRQKRDRQDKQEISLCYVLSLKAKVQDQSSKDRSA
jgi:hypothetical protein